MQLMDFMVAGLAGGVLMGVLAEVGYMTTLFKMSLFRVDGEFALKLLGLKYRRSWVYVLGIPIHLITGTVFGLGYSFFNLVFPLDPKDLSTVAIYTFILWVSMLCCALPIAGQGWLGQKAGNRIWLEQFLVHIAFGVGLWWAL